MSHPTSLHAYYRLVAAWLASDHRTFSPLSLPTSVSAAALAKVLVLGEQDIDFPVTFYPLPPVSEAFVQDFSPYQAALFTVSRQDYRPLLGQCRLWLPKVAFFTQTGVSPLDLTAALAMGFEKIYQWPWQESELSLYLFQLYAYKSPPDWLNNRYWANPELFDKFRW